MADKTQTQSKGMATLALVLGIVSFLAWMFSSYLSVMMGLFAIILSIKNMKTSKGMSIAAIVLSVLGILLAVWAGNF